MTEPNPFAQVESLAKTIRGRTDHRPQIALVLGTGLSAVADAVEEADIISYDTLPGWPVSTVAGHAGRLVLGHFAGKSVIVQKGRSHLYEGYSPAQIVLPVRVMHALGAQILIATNAAGGINRNFTPGDLMVISDHLNMVGMAGFNPLRGPNDEQYGPRFPDLTRAYDPQLRGLAHRAAAELGLQLKEGVYVYLAGPSFETPAELRFLHAAGADAVGMSTVPSVIAARHLGMRVLAISTITNKSILDPDDESTLSHEEVLEIGRQVLPRLTGLLAGILQHL